MTEDAEKIERSRQRREDELLLMLLLISDDARRDTAVAIRYGFAVHTVLQSSFNRAVPIIAGAMADAHADAYRRVVRLSGESVEQPNPTAVALMYEQHARDAAQAMTSRLYDAVTAAQNEQAGISTRGITEPPAPLSPKALVRKAFDDVGYSRTNATGLDIGTERAIVFASNVGMIAASSQSGIVTGLRHISVMDDRTTRICIDRDKLALPIDDSYWYLNIPPLHPRCRSIIMPIIGPFFASERYPIVPPFPGFGVAPPGLIEGLKAIGRAA